MARALARKWVGVLTGLVLMPAWAGAAPPGYLLYTSLGAVPGQVPGRTRIHTALNGAIEAHRRGDYEQAATLFRQAEQNKGDLSPEEQSELSRHAALNATALKSRQEGAEQLRLAEQALRAGRTGEADDLVKRASVNQYLTAADKQTARQLASQVRPTGGPVGGGNSLTLARAKVQQARALLARGDFAAAEVLAGEADRLKAPFTPREDTPAKVLEDIHKVKNDPKALVAAARTALEGGDLDRAESLARAAEQSESVWAMRPFADNSGKVLKDVQTARAKVAAVQAPRTPTVVTANKPADRPMTPAKSVAEAAPRSGVVPASAPMPAPMTRPASEATPTVPQASKPMGQGAVAQKTSPPQDPRALVKQGRDLLEAGKIDEALQKAQLARTSGAVRWGLFEDNPDKLQKDVDKARTRRDQEEAGRALAEGRSLLEKGDVDGAQRLAYKAAHLHGPYSVWDLGDRPQKLIADAESIRSKQRKPGLPPIPGAAVAKKDTPAAPTSPVAPTVDPKAQEARRLLVEARSSLKAGDHQRAQALFAQAERLPVKVEGPDGTEAIRRELAQTQGLVRTGAEAPAMTVPAAPPAPPVDPRKPQALALMAEAKRLDKAGDLVAARQKVLEAQKVGATFSPEEEYPDRMLLQLASKADGRIHTLVQQAGDLAAAGPSGKTQAEVVLAEARKLAQGFGLDTGAIDARTAALQPTAPAVAQAPAIPTLPSVPVPVIPMPPTVAQAPVLPPVPVPSAPVLPPVPVPSAPALPDMPVPVAGATPPAVPVPVALPSAPVAAPAMTLPVPVPSVAQAPVPSVVPPTGAAPSGSTLLDQARNELRSGQLAGARRLAEEAFKPKYGVQAQAEALLRSIDVEEFNQRQLTANKAFDAAMSAYNRQDHAQASMILRSLDVKLLEPAKAARMREVMNSTEMQPGNVGTVATKPVAPSGVVQASVGAARATDTPEQDLAKQTLALQEVKFQQLRSQGQQVQRDATARFQAGETDRALEMLQDFSASLRQSSLEPDRVALISRPLETQLQRFKTMKSQRDYERNLAHQRNAGTEKVRQMQLNEQKKQENVANLMKQYNTLLREAKYPEAELAALKAQELDPDNPLAGAAVQMARTMRNISKSKQSKETREKYMAEGLSEAENEGRYVNSDSPLAIDPEVHGKASQRKDLSKGMSLLNKSGKEREIEQKLYAPVTLSFKDKPLSQVIDELHTLHDINIVPDKAALDDAGISLDRPVSIKLEGVSLRSALNLMLGQMKLTYVIKDEVLNITTEANSKGKLVTKTYPVADLVIPVTDSTLPASANLGRALETLGSPNRGANTPAATPVLGSNAMNGGTAVGNAGTSSNPGVTIKSATDTMQELLMKLITDSIKPSSWSDMGGPGTINYYPLGMALIVNQTEDIQEQVFELLQALRRLQDQEVTVEVRFISLAESFFERIGIDFNVNLKTDQETKRWEQLLTSGQFKPFGFINDFTPNKFVAGLSPAGGGAGATPAFTSDLDIPITQSSFARAIPPFGAFPNQPGANGGLSMGLAFLSDIQVYLFMEAAQGDQRTNVMQAPKLTLFNGQTSTLTVSDQQFFVTNVQVVQSNGQLAFVPNNFPIPTGGVNLTLQAVISADRRYVRLSLSPSLTNLASAVIPLFPIVTPIFPIFEGGFQAPPVLFTQFIQQPVFNTISLQTTVNVPDGGTVLLGGLKRLSEGRNEFGPPVLSKVPYLNRLFKNVGYGRETESLLIMVTPRIIINEEEEEIQTGQRRPQSSVIE